MRCFTCVCWCSLCCVELSVVCLTGICRRSHHLFRVLPNKMVSNHCYLSLHIYFSFRYPSFYFSIISLFFNNYFSINKFWCCYSSENHVSGRFRPVSWKNTDSDSISVSWWKHYKFMYTVVFALQPYGPCHLCKAAVICCECDDCAAVAVGAKRRSFSAQVAAHASDVGRQRMPVF